MFRDYGKFQLLLLLAVASLLWTVTVCQAALPAARTAPMLVDLKRRQNLTAPTDKNRCDNSIYCQPSAGDVIKNGSIIVSWNGARFEAAGDVSVRLKAADGANRVLSELIHPAVPSWTEITIKKEFFDPPPKLNETAWRLVRFQIEPPGGPSTRIGPTFNITMVGSDHESPPTDRISSPEQSESGTETPVAAFIAILCGVVGAIIAVLLAIFWLRRRKAKTASKSVNLNGDYPPTPTTAGAMTGRSIAGRNYHTGGMSTDSLTPLSAGLSQSERPTSPADTSGHSHLSTGDAALIAATFRELLRKPSWKNGVNEEEEEEEEMDEEDREASYDARHLSTRPAIRINTAQATLDPEKMSSPSPLVFDLPPKLATQ